VKRSAVLIADSCCDLPLELLERRDIEGLSFPYVGPVIGSHTGPGMIAAPFWGRPA
jgi:fatty acid-binding protein DegV